MRLFGPRVTLSPAQREDLRDDGNFIGGLLIAVLCGLNFVFPIMQLALTFAGVLSAESLQYDDFGLGNTTFLLVYAAIYVVAMGAPVLLCCTLFRRLPHKLTSAKRVRFGTGIAALVIGMGVCFVATVLAGIVGSALQEKGISQSGGTSYLVGTPQSLWLNVLVFAALPALLEELVFRVCVLGTLRKYGEWFAVIVSALLFGWIHGGISQSVFACVVGLVLGYITVSLGNIWLAVLIHFGNNAFTLFLEYFSMHLEEEQAAILYVNTWYPLGIVGLATAIICALNGSPVFRRFAPLQRPRIKTVAVFWTSPLMIFGTIMIVLNVLLALAAALS